MHARFTEDLALFRVEGYVYARNHSYRPHRSADKSDMNRARRGLKTNRTSEHRSGAALVLCVRQRRRDSLITCLPLPPSLLSFGGRGRTNIRGVCYVREIRRRRRRRRDLVRSRHPSLPPSPSRNENWAMFPHPHQPHMLRKTGMLYFQ